MNLFKPRLCLDKIDGTGQYSMQINIPTYSEEIRIADVTTGNFPKWKYEVDRAYPVIIRLKGSHDREIPHKRSELNYTLKSLDHLGEDQYPLVAVYVMMNGEVKHFAIHHYQDVG